MEHPWYTRPGDHRNAHPNAPSYPDAGIDPDTRIYLEDPNTHFYLGPDPDTDSYQTSPPGTPRLNPTKKQDQQGYLCLSPGCDAPAFKRKADLDRHYEHGHVPEDQQQAWRCDSQQGYHCLSPGCDAPAFKRKADLDRHYKHKHIPEDQQRAWRCDYPRCNRRSAEAPFRRKDHFRDHLRDFHKEDVGKRGKIYSTDNTGQDRNINNSWWRCPRCLIRVYVTSCGYQCPDCHSTCDDARKRERQDTLSATNQPASA